MYRISKNVLFLAILKLFFFSTSTTAQSVQSPPKILQQPSIKEITFRDKEYLILKCEAEGKPTPEYRWTKNGENFDWRNYSTKIIQEPGYGTLNFTKPKTKDEGQYQCFAYNLLGTATSNSIRVVKVKKKHSPGSSVSRIEGQEGKPFRFNCDVPFGWPKPSVSWVKKYQDSGQIVTVDDNRMAIDSTGTLWISYLRKDDTSDGFMYTCRLIYEDSAINGNGIHLTVVESPEIILESPIQQYVTRKNETAVVGEKVELFCIYSGNPVPQTNWFINGSSILIDKSRVQLYNYGKSLIINNVTTEDKGIYTCSVYNGVGQNQSYNIELDVMVVPNITVRPEIIEKRAGETAVIRCEANGYPKPEIKWIHNGQLLSASPMINRGNVSSNSITIIDLAKSDTGNYGCNATNSVGYDYEDVYINVLTFAPTIIKPLQNIETVVGNSITIVCENNGAPMPRKIWTHNGTELLDERYSKTNTGDLQIRKVEITDSGNYTCFTENEEGTDNASLKLTVKEPIQIVVEPKDVAAMVQTTVTFNCKEPTGSYMQHIEIEWLFNDKPIDSDNQFRIIQTGSNLTISKITEMDSGSYTCLAKTNLNNATATAMLIVQNKPNPPKILEVKCVKKNATVKWQPNGDNRAPILHYTIEYNYSSAPNNWLVAVENLAASEQMYTVPMKVWTNSTFRITATNVIGKSNSSEHSDVCVTDPDVPYKNPDNVEVHPGSEPSTLVISWTPLSKDEHNAPGLKYRVYWKVNDSNGDWESENIDFDKRIFLINKNVQPNTFYRAKVVAFNEMGECKERPIEISGLSGKNESTIISKPFYKYYNHHVILFCTIFIIVIVIIVLICIVKDRKRKNYDLRKLEKSNIQRKYQNDQPAQPLIDQNGMIKTYQLTEFVTLLEPRFDDSTIDEGINEASSFTGINGKNNGVQPF